MKKILFGIFGIMLTITSGYCDGELSVINTNGSYQNVLDSEIRVDAIRKILNSYRVFASDKIVSRILKEIKRNGKITVGSFYEACIKGEFWGNGAPEWQCQLIIEPLIREHNRLVLESTNDGLLTEEQFNKLYYNKLECDTRILKVNEDSCKNACISYAINHGFCKLFGYQYYEAGWPNRNLDGCWCNPGGKDITIFEYIPTYEDYKHEKGIK